MTLPIESILNYPHLAADLRDIGKKVLNEVRITPEEGVLLYEKADLSYLGALANVVRERKHGDNTYFNRNFHIEPTNLCVYSCKFCSYSRLIKQKEEGWLLNKDQMMDIVRSYDHKAVTEVHIVGGVLPQMNLAFFTDLLKSIKQHRPELHIKGFTAVEYYYMFKKAKVSYTEGLQLLREAGLDSIPGGGAEIFHHEIREQICADKCTGQEWLDIHEAAHSLGIPSNCTMLYGHIEKYWHRIDHLEQLRQLQDRTKGMNCFIPLKYRHQNNEMGYLSEVTVLEDLRNYAVSRIYLDNIPHLKAYWPMIGKTTTQLSLAFGVNDIDGTIDDTTKIYSMAGAEDQNPSMSTQQLVQLIKNVDRTPIERDSVFRPIKDYSNEVFSTEQFIPLPIIQPNV